MTTEFVDDEIWTRLRRLARTCQRPAFVAVAYFGKGGAKLLPLRQGSRLVVDASELAVKAGLTHPADLLKLQAKGVRVYSVQNLHAKVYVFGGQAFIGSANASNRSAHTLKEALLRTTDREAVKGAREFVRSLCLEELGPEELQRLQKIYRPPRLPGGKRIASNGRPRRVKAKYSGLRIAKLRLIDYPRGSESAAEEGLVAAKAKRDKRSTHHVDEYCWTGGTFLRGETVVQVLDEGNGATFVSPPGRVIHTKNWSNGRRRCTFVYLEVPNRRRVRLDRLAQRLGRGSRKRLQRSGHVKSDFAEQLRQAWQA